MVGPDDLDFGDFLDDLEEEHGVFDLGLRDDPGSLLRYLHVRRGRVIRSNLHSMSVLSLNMELCLHGLLIFQLVRELTSHQ